VRALRRGRGIDDFAQAARDTAPLLTAARPAATQLGVPARLLAPFAAPLESLSSYLAPYRREILLAPEGFLRWGGFRYNDGQAKGARAVRFSMVFTCHRARDPYPAPGRALSEEAPCR
jgi:hypothetical protein